MTVNASSKISIPTTNIQLQKQHIHLSLSQQKSCYLKKKHQQNNNQLRILLKKEFNEGRKIAILVQENDIHENLSKQLFPVVHLAWYSLDFTVLRFVSLASSSFPALASSAS